MTNYPSTVKYVMDTNTLINFSIWNPIRLNKFFWDKLSISLEEGRWILLDVVVKEVTYEGDLKEWCKNQRRKNLVTEISDDDKNKAAEINNEYQMINQDTFKSTVDTYIIAFAIKNQVAVFSREKHKSNEEKLYKIPDVCDNFKVKHTQNPEKFLESIGYKS